MRTDKIGLSTRSGNAPTGSLSRIALLTATLAAAAACPGDDAEGDNVLPSGSGTTGDGDETTDASATSAEPTQGVETEGAAGFPAAFRFDCIDIQMLGTRGRARCVEDAGRRRPARPHVRRGRPLAVPSLAHRRRLGGSGSESPTYLRSCSGQATPHCPLRQGPGRPRHLP